MYSGTVPYHIVLPALRLLLRYSALPYSACPEAVAQVQCFVQVPSEHRRGQAVHCIVRTFDHLINSLETDDLLDGAKNLTRNKAQQEDYSLLSTRRHVL